MTDQPIKERHGVSGLKKIDGQTPAYRATVEDGDGVLLIALTDGPWIQFTPAQALLFAQQIRDAANRVARPI